jgi:uncharacterized protein DUF998
VKLSRLAALCGIAGPLLFTAAWVVSSLRQAGHSAVGVQLSGLAAPDARDPQIVMAGFVVLGVCSIGFGAALGQVTAPRSAGPWLVMVAGAATVAAGVFRRDHMLLAGPGFAGESWHNQVHDVVSGVVYLAMLAAPLMLGRHFRDDPDWAVVAGRNFCNWEDWKAAAASGAALMWRVKSDLTLPVLDILPAGSCSPVLVNPKIRGKARARLTGAARAGDELDEDKARYVRVIEYEVPGRDGDGKEELIALITTIAEVMAAPAATLAETCHQRWEHGTGHARPPAIKLANLGHLSLAA